MAPLPAARPAPVRAGTGRRPGRARTRSPSRTARSRATPPARPATTSPSTGAGAWAATAATTSPPPSCRTTASPRPSVRPGGRFHGPADGLPERPRAVRARHRRQGAPTTGTSTVRRWRCPAREAAPAPPVAGRGRRPPPVRDRRAGRCGGGRPGAAGRPGHGDPERGRGGPGTRPGLPVGGAVAAVASASARATREATSLPCAPWVPPCASLPPGRGAGAAAVYNRSLNVTPGARRLCGDRPRLSGRT